MERGWQQDQSVPVNYVIEPLVFTLERGAGKGHATADSGEVITVGLVGGRGRRWWDMLERKW